MQDEVEHPPKTRTAARCHTSTPPQSIPLATIGRGETRLTKEDRGQDHPPPRPQVQEGPRSPRKEGQSTQTPSLATTEEACQPGAIPVQNGESKVGASPQYPAMGSPKRWTRPPGDVEDPAIKTRTKRPCSPIGEDAERGGCQSPPIQCAERSGFTPNAIRKTAPNHDQGAPRMDPCQHQQRRGPRWMPPRNEATRCTRRPRRETPGA